MSAQEGCVPLANKAGAPCGVCGSITDVCMKPESKEPAFADHDAMARRLPDEPYFALLARDPISSYFANIYAAVRLRQWSQLSAIMSNMRAAVEHEAPKPHKDKEHGWSARAKALEMDNWRLENMPTKPLRGRVNNTPEEQPVPNFSEITRLTKNLEIFREVVGDPMPVFPNTALPSLSSIVPSDSEEVVCSKCDGLVHPSGDGKFQACGATECPFFIAPVKYRVKQIVPDMFGNVPTDLHVGDTVYPSKAVVGIDYSPDAKIFVTRNPNGNEGFHHKVSISTLEVIS